MKLSVLRVVPDVWSENQATAPRVWCSNAQYLKIWLTNGDSFDTLATTCNPRYSEFNRWLFNLNARSGAVANKERGKKYFIGLSYRRPRKIFTTSDFEARIHFSWFVKQSPTRTRNHPLWSISMWWCTFSHTVQMDSVCTLWSDLLVKGLKGSVAFCESFIHSLKVIRFSLICLPRMLRFVGSHSFEKFRPRAVHAMP